MPRVYDKQAKDRRLVALADEASGFEALIAPGFGAACVSLKWEGEELLHAACVFDQGPMRGRIPVLFPTVGRSFHNGRLGFYRHRGIVYPMDIHGFAKDRAWRETDRRADARRASVTCRLDADERTRASYPYDFSLEIEYAVEGASLALSAAVRNEGEGEMPFCFGYHPYFRAPLSGGSRAGCVVRVPGRAVWEMEAGQPTGRRLPAPPEFAAGLSLPEGHMERILADLTRPEGAAACFCELEWREAGKALRIEFDERKLETVTVFSPADSGFVCLEPRAGLPNALSDAAPVVEGVKRLAAGEEFSCVVRIRARRL